MSKRQHEDIQRLDHDDDYKLDSKKLKLYSDDDSSTTTIILIDNDINHLKSNVYNLLKLKFENQQAGKKLWLERRELTHYEFIPIEFSKDLYFVNNFFKRMLEIEGKNPYSWYEDYCFDILSDEVRMEIDVVFDSELRVFNFEYSTPSISLVNRINRICNQSETKSIEIISKFATQVDDIDQFVNDFKYVFPVIEKLLNDEEFFLKCIASNYKVILFFGMIDDDNLDEEDVFELIEKCVDANPNVLGYISDISNLSSIFEDKQVVMDVIPSIDKIVAESYFTRLSDNLMNDRDVVLKAAENGFNVLPYINSEELKNDREIVLNFVTHDGYLLAYALDHFKNDREIVLHSVRSYGLSLEHASDQFKNDREIVTEAVKQCCKSLEHASDDLKNDRDFILEMVSKYKAPLGYASKLLQQDRELILTAMKIYPDTIYSEESEHSSTISNELLMNREFILECVKVNGCCLECLPPIYLLDTEIVTEAIKQNPLSLCEPIGVIDISGMDYKNTFLDAVELMHLKYADGDINKERQYMSLLSVIDDLDIAKKLIETIPFSIHYLNEKFREHYPEFTYKLTLLHSGYWMKYSEDAYQERINHAYHSATIDLNSEVKYFRNVLKTNLLWKDLKWKRW